MRYSAELAKDDNGKRLSLDATILEADTLEQAREMALKWAEPIAIMSMEPIVLQLVQNGKGVFTHIYGDVDATRS